MALLDRMRSEAPEIWNQALVVGKWVWLEFNIPPIMEVRTKLKELGFHWNAGRKCWQHPCGEHRPRSDLDPRGIYPVVPAPAMALNEAVAKPSGATAKEFKVVALRECPLPESMQVCETPQGAADYWRLNVVTNPYFNPECECL